MSFAADCVGKKVLVFGLGLQGGGVGDALWLHGRGAKVRITDQKSKADLALSLAKLPSTIGRSLGSHSENDIAWADIIIKNPGVPDDHPLLLQAANLGKPIYTSIALFVSEFRTQTIGITGTRGKSTTTELIYRLLDSVYPGQIIRGGNIPGTSGLALLDYLTTAKYAVLELSSFQLHSFHALQVSPHFSVITNLYPDHLNRYPSMDAYLADKQAIVAYQTSQDYTLYNLNNPGSIQIGTSSLGTHIGFASSDVPTTWKISLPGLHNRENIAACLKLAHLLHIDDEQVKNVISNFHGLPYRLENRGVKGGITYINDTTATTPTATIKAIASLTQPTILILGGQSKGLPMEELFSAINSTDLVKQIVVLGSAGFDQFLDGLRSAAGPKIAGQVFSMAEAVKLASSLAKPGWNVLLSPAFASFDLFQNEFDRGQQFNDCVKALSQ